MTVYGQGWHTSTQWYLKQVEALVKPGQAVLDFGAGTGILAIAAARLGATVTACENDSGAMDLCRRNVVLNGLMVACVDVPTETYDLIFANIGPGIKEPGVRELLDGCLKPGGRLVLEVE